MSLNAGRSFVEFLKLGRPKFLVGGFLLFGLGSALAATEGVLIDWRRYLWGQAIVTATQWMTHYSNDYFDLEVDRANATPTEWSGGSRVLLGGRVSPRAALAAALALGAAGLVASIALSMQASAPPLVLPIALLMLGLSWCYSAPPLRLLSRGLGELTTAVVVTLLTPLLGFYLQTGVLRPVLFLACFPVCGLQFAMLLAIELPDAAGDAAQGKRTLVVRHGAQWGARLCAGLVATSFFALPVLVVLGLPQLVAALALLPLPLASWHCHRLLRGAYRDPKAWGSLALTSVALLASMTAAELAGAVIISKWG